MIKTYKRHMAIILIIAMMLACLPNMAYAIEIPDGYNQSSTAGDTVSSDVFISMETSNNGDNQGGDNNSGDNTGEDNKPGGNTDDMPDGDNEDKKPDNKDYPYVINYYYGDNMDQKTGMGKIGEQLPYELTTPKEYSGHNYVLDSFEIVRLITNNPEKNISNIYYEIDDKDKDGNIVPGGDGIADKYQTPNDKYTTEDTFGYKVTYNYKDKTELINSFTKAGQGTVGSVIPYSYSNLVNKEEQTFKLESLIVNSNIITPNEMNNTVEVNYLLTNDEQTGNIEPVQYMVSVDPDNGEQIIIYYVKEGEKLPDLSNPMKDGCKFVGWIDNNGDIVDADTIVNSNMFLKALWQLKDTAAEYTVSHYKPAKADDSQEFQGFELVTIDKYTGEVGSTVQVKAKNWDNYKVDTTNKNSVMSGVISSDGSLVLRVFYIADNTGSNTKPGDSGNTSGGGSGSAGGSGSGGGNHSGGKPSGNNKPGKPSDSNNGSTEFNDNFEMLIGLDKTNHIAYIKGYTDGTMQPNGNITRGEVAEIVYRLMTDEYRNAYYTTENQFSDVIANIWCNASISTGANAGILKGYEDGEFKFNNYITRAEFATIVSRFFKIDTLTQSEMTDIQGHWAEEAINKIVAVGWVQGYENNTFKPNNFITRAEAVTIFNRILERNVKERGLLDEKKEWADVNNISWYYLDIQEAANAHTYTRDADYSELWQSVVE